MSIDTDTDRDIELGGDQVEEGEEKVDNEQRMKEEEEMKKAKERQAFLENLYVLICMLIIVAMAVVIVVLKINIFQTDPNITFIPLTQQVIFFYNRLGQILNQSLFQDSQHDQVYWQWIRSL